MPPWGAAEGGACCFLDLFLNDFSTIFGCSSMFFNDFCRKDWFPRPLLSRPHLGVTDVIVLSTTFSCVCDSPFLAVFRRRKRESQSSKNKKRHKTGHRGRFSSSDRSFPTSLTPRNIFQAEFFVENGIFDKFVGGNCQS